MDTHPCYNPTIFPMAVMRVQCIIIDNIAAQSEEISMWFSAIRVHKKR